MPSNIPTPNDLTGLSKEKDQLQKIRGNAAFSGLTAKRKKLAEIMISNPTMSLQQAAKEAGYKVGPKSNMSVLKKEIAGKLGKTFRDHGIHERDLAIVAHDGLHAMKATIIRRKEFVPGTTKVIREYYDVIEVPDHRHRLATFAKICELGGYFPATKIDVGGAIELRPFADVPQIVLEQRAKELEKKAAVEAEFTVEETADVVG